MTLDDCMRAMEIYEALKEMKKDMDEDISLSSTSALALLYKAGFIDGKGRN